MWIARDEDNTLHLFDEKIVRITDNWCGYWQTPNGYFNSSMQLNEKLFPNLKWEDEPIEVTIVNKSIDEDTLDELAWCQWAINFYPDKRLKDIYANGFKDGYCKAIEE